MYHDVRPRSGRADSMYTLDPQRLREQLEDVKRSGRTAVLARELPLVAEPSVAITFDDGRAGAVEHALPLLADFEVPATLFVTASAVGTPEWCTTRDLAAWIDAGNEIGTHGWTHRSLTSLSPAGAAQEISRSVGALEDATGSRVLTMSFPNGRLSSRLVRAALEQGLDAVYGSWPGYGRGIAGAYGRFAILNRTSPWAFRQILDGRGRLAYAPQRFLFLAGRVIGESAYTRVHGALRRG